MPLPSTLAEWLAHCERLHPRTIDLTLARMAVLRERLSLSFAVPLVIVAGTNGKGSTCAMLEAVAMQAGYRVGVHTSPHLVHFEERCRIDGRPVQAAALLPHFEAVERIRGDIAPTFFEFTLLAIVRLLVAQRLDLVVLEVGLGGRFDAVNAFDADCAVITSIDLDHMEYLGPTREAIGFEKAGIMRAGRPVVVSDPMPPQSIARHAAAVGADLRLSGRDFSFSGDRQQWNWAGRELSYKGLAYPALRGANQLLNAAGVLAAFEALRETVPITAQAVRSGLATTDLPGRFQIVPGQPTIVLDVAHNPHAVAALVQNLDQMGFYPRTHAVFGAMRDKDTLEILRRMSPVIDAWHFTDLPTARAASAQALLEQHAELVRSGVRRAPAAVSAECHADPSLALRAALESADPADRIVVFGSFFTVGGVLGNGLPRTAAKHAV